MKESKSIFKIRSSDVKYSKSSFPGQVFFVVGLEQPLFQAYHLNSYVLFKYQFSHVKISDKQIRFGY